MDVDLILKFKLNRLHLVHKFKICPRSAFKLISSLKRTFFLERTDQFSRNWVSASCHWNPPKHQRHHLPTICSNNPTDSRICEVWNSRYEFSRRKPCRRAWWGYRGNPDRQLLPFTGYSTTPYSSAFAQIRKRYGVLSVLLTISNIKIVPAY
jgi:hypothetical protein